MAQDHSEQIRVKQILQRAKQDIEKIFTRVEQELCEDTTARLPIFEIIERRFGRLFSPHELETVINWTHNFSPDMIELAINEAEARNKLVVRYIDKILLNWEKDGVKTPKQAVEYSQKFSQHTNQGLTKTIPSSEAPAKVNFYNWLEERG